MPKSQIQIPFTTKQSLDFQTFMADKVMSGSKVMDAFGDARVDLNLRKYTVLTLKDFYYAINKQYGPIVRWDKRTKSWSRVDRAIASPTKKVITGSNKTPTSIKDVINGETLDLSESIRGNDLAFLDISIGGAEIRIQFK